MQYNIWIEHLLTRRNSLCHRSVSLKFSLIYVIRISPQQRKKNLLKHKSSTCPNIDICSNIFNIIWVFQLKIVHIGQRFPLNSKKLWNKNVPTKGKSVLDRIVGYHSSSWLTAHLNLCPIWPKLLVHEQHNRCTCTRSLR